MSYPLHGVRILELGQIIDGTYGSQVLSDLGAEVIKATLFCASCWGSP